MNTPTGGDPNSKLFSAMRQHTFGNNSEVEEAFAHKLEHRTYPKTGRPRVRIKPPIKGLNPLSTRGLK